MSEVAVLQKRFFDVAVINGAYTKPDRLQVFLNYIFDGTSLQGRNVLDVGGGTGLLTLWAAVNGANAVCLEPESAGSTQSVRKVFERMKTEISPDLKATMSPDYVQDYLASCEKKFDIIVMANSINHIAEEQCATLLYNEASRDSYVSFFEQLKTHLTAGGHLIVTDCDRRNFFGDLGVRSPIMPTIDWSIHQSPSTWKDLMEKAGFRITSIKWSTPNFLGTIGKVLLGNRFAAYFLFSHFRIAAKA
jgi:cyclopropane fatty-acyl-phospholipid synthase-like methyltransferase